VILTLTTEFPLPLRKSASERTLETLNLFRGWLSRHRGERAKEQDQDFPCLPVSFSCKLQGAGFSV
jgi:hypothetical protein